jgi:hypothetical protein
VVRDELHRYKQAIKIMSHMVGVEIYALGLLEMGKILELDRQELKQNVAELAH